MFCQQCGRKIRASAKFCNGCGNRVKQRFGEGVAPASASSATVPPPVAPPPPPRRTPADRPADSASRRKSEGAKKSAFAENSWPGAEEVTVIPVVALPRPAQAVQTPPTVHQPAPTQEFIPVKHGEPTDPLGAHSALATGSHQAVETGEINEALAEKARREEEYKPFFTQIGPAVTNRQHNRVVMVVPLLLIVSLLLFLFAYIASK